MGSANDAFDVAYLALQGACALVWILALLGVPGVGARGGAAWLALGAAACAGVVLPIAWHVGWPPTSGIEGAGRILLGAPPSFVNALAGALVAGRLLRRAGAPLSRAARGAVVPVTCTALWLWLLAS